MNAFKRLRIKYRLFRPSRRYDHLVLLGYNCETAFQFFKMYHFLESSLFAWSYAYSLQDTLYALQHLNQVGTLGFLPPNPLWECTNTHIRFHGKENELSRSQAEQELTRRVAYLSHKLQHLYTVANSSILYVVKVRSNPAPLNAQLLPQLVRTLTTLTVSSFDLLIICEKDAVLPVLSDPHIFVRRVAHFAPEQDVTNTALAANADWERIFSEFGPKHYLKHTKHFKFETL